MEDCPREMQYPRWKAAAAFAPQKLQVHLQICYVCSSTSFAPPSFVCAPPLLILLHNPQCKFHTRTHTSSTRPLWPVCLLKCVPLLCFHLMVWERCWQKQRQRHSEREPELLSSSVWPAQEAITTKERPEAPPKGDDEEDKERKRGRGIERYTPIRIVQVLVVSCRPRKGRGTPINLLNIIQQLD